MPPTFVDEIKALASLFKSSKRPPPRRRARARVSSTKVREQPVTSNDVYLAAVAICLGFDELGGHRMKINTALAIMFRPHRHIKSSNPAMNFDYRPSQGGLEMLARDSEPLLALHEDEVRLPMPDPKDPNHLQFHFTLYPHEDLQKDPRDLEVKLISKSKSKEKETTSVRLPVYTAPVLLLSFVKEALLDEYDHRTEGVPWLMGNLYSISLLLVANVKYAKDEVVPGGSDREMWAFFDLCIDENVRDLQEWVCYLWVYIGIPQIADRMYDWWRDTHHREAVTVEQKTKVIGGFSWSLLELIRIFTRESRLPPLRPPFTPNLDPSSTFSPRPASPPPPGEPFHPGERDGPLPYGVRYASPQSPSMPPPPERRRTVPIIVEARHPREEKKKRR
ncbi:hypothetical protein JCM8097_002402 [Rhodosporidiobolus ruineniae]